MIKNLVKISIYLLGLLILTFSCQYKQKQTHTTSTLVEQVLPDNLDAPDKIWEQIDKLPIMLPLSKYPENINLRKKLVSKLDKHMTYYKYHVYSPGSDDKSYGNRDGSNNAQETPFTTAYRKRVQKVIDEIDLLQPKEDELIIWKLYSSGYIFKSPKYVFANNGYKNIRHLSSKPRNHNNCNTQRICLRN